MAQCRRRSPRTADGNSVSGVGDRCREQLDRDADSGLPVDGLRGERARYVFDVDGVMRAKGAPLFETGDERYAWLNSVQAIGLGSAEAGGVDYEVYAVL